MVEDRHDLQQPGLQDSRSRLSLGAWVTYGGTHDDEVSYQCMTVAPRGGVNFFDNAEGCRRQCRKGHGACRQALGGGWHLSLADLVISTKIFEMGRDPRGTQTRRACRASTSSMARERHWHGCRWIMWICRSVIVLTRQLLSRRPWNDGLAGQPGPCALLGQYRSGRRKS